MDVVIRAATDADGPALRALDAAAWSPTFSPSPAPNPDAARDMTADDGLEILVAELGGEVAGYASLGRSLPMESNAHVLEVKGLNVAEAHKRKGIGGALLTAIADHASARGARKLRLRVLGNNDGARALYESLGYRDEGVLRGEFLLEGHYVDDHLMAIDLTSEDER